MATKLKKATCDHCGVLLRVDDPDNICWECFLDGGYRSQSEVITRKVKYVSEDNYDLFESTKEIRHEIDDKPKAIKKAHAT